jgi:hypothetical protein
VSNTSKIPVLAPSTSAERLARAFSAFDSLEEQLKIPMLQRQPDPAFKPTSDLASRIPALTYVVWATFLGVIIYVTCRQRFLNSSTTDSQPFVAQTSSLSTSSSGSILHQEGSADDATGEPDSAQSPNINEESQPIFHVSQIPATPRPGSDSVRFENLKEYVILDHARANDAPLANDADHGRDAKEGAIQDPFPARDDTIILSPPPYPTPTEPSALASSAGGKPPREAQIRIPDLAHARAPPTISLSESTHARARSSLNHGISVSSGTQETYPPPSQNSVSLPETEALMSSNEPVRRRKSIASRSTSAPAVPHWVHFVEPEARGHDQKDMSLLSLTTGVGPFPPVDVAYGELSDPLGDRLDDAENATTPNLATAPLVDRDGEKPSFNDPQDFQSTAAEAATSNISLSTMPHTFHPGFQPPSVPPVTNQANFQVERAESSLTNVASSASAKPVQELREPSGVGIKNMEPSRTLAQRSKPAPTVARPTKDTLARRTSAHKLKNRTDPIQDVASESRVVSNANRTRPKAIMPNGQAKSRERPHTKASMAARGRSVGVEHEARHPVLEGVHVEPVPPDSDVYDTLLASKREPETSCARFAYFCPHRSLVWPNGAHKVTGAPREKACNIRRDTFRLVLLKVMVFFPWANRLRASRIALPPQWMLQEIL